MKARVAGRHDAWLPLPTGRYITARVKHCMNAYQALWGMHPLAPGHTREMTEALLHHYLPRLERAETAEYYRFVQKVIKSLGKTLGKNVK